MEKDTTQEILAAIQNLTAANQPTHANGGLTGWSKPKPQTSTGIIGVSIPISLETDSGKIRVYLHFGPEAATSPDALYGLIQSLEAQGLPLDIWGGKKSWKKKTW